MPPLQRYDDPAPSPGRPEPPRAAYQSDAPPVWPPVPPCCPRCSGYVLTQYGETQCLICAWRLHPIPLPQEPDMMKSGPQLANVIEVSW